MFLSIKARNLATRKQEICVSRARKEKNRYFLGPSREQWRREERGDAADAQAAALVATAFDLARARAHRRGRWAKEQPHGAQQAGEWPALDAGRGEAESSKNMSHTFEEHLRSKLQVWYEKFGRELSRTSSSECFDIC